LGDAREAIARFNARDPEEIEEKIVEALIKAGWVDDPFGVEVLHPLIKEIGESLEGVRGRVKELEARRVVRFEWGPEGNELVDAGPFPRLGRWVRCGHSDPDSP
jgi:hypothetical protein